MQRFADAMQTGLLSLWHAITSVFPRGKTPGPGTFADIEFESFQLPLRIQVDSRSHCFLVPRTGGRWSSIFASAPYACVISKISKFL